MDKGCCLQLTIYSFWSSLPFHSKIQISSLNFLTSINSLVAIRLWNLLWNWFEASGEWLWVKAPREWHFSHQVLLWGIEPFIDEENTPLCWGKVRISRDANVSKNLDFSGRYPQQSIRKKEKLFKKACGVWGGVNWNAKVRKSKKNVQQISGIFFETASLMGTDCRARSRAVLWNVKWTRAGVEWKASNWQFTLLDLHSPCVRSCTYPFLLILPLSWKSSDNYLSITEVWIERFLLFALTTTQLEGL